MPLTLTKGERLLLDRKRRAETQAQAAVRYNVSPKIYGLWERDQYEASMGIDTSFLLGRLKPHERCLIRRRREQLTQGALAKRMGCSRWWLLRMEQGEAPVRDLVEYWSD